MQFIYRITLRGTQPGDTTTLTYDLGDFAEPVDWSLVQAAADQIRGALVDITDAFIAKETLSGILSSDNSVPTDADTTDELVIITHLNAVGEAEKLHATRVPAPVSTVFQPGGEVLDKTNADVIQFVQQLAQHAYVSDGEQINTAAGNDGMKKGYWRSRSATRGK